MAPAASKLDTLPFNCYELAHTWHPNCTQAAIDLGGSAFKEALKIYTTCYVISLIASRKPPKGSNDVLKLVKDILRSSLFLGGHGVGFTFFLCTLRKLKGNFNYWTMSYIPAFLASYASIFIEKPQRRPLLAIYVTNVASETIYRMLRSRGLVKDIAYFEFFLFTLSLTSIIYHIKAGVRKPDVIDTILKNIFGPEEFKRRHGEEPVIRHERPQSASPGPRRISLGGPGLRVEVENRSEEDQVPRRTVDDTFRNRFVHFVLWMHKSVEEIASHLERMVAAVYEGQVHSMCPHSQSCFDYWMEGFFSRFVTGFGLHVVFQAIVLSKKLIMPRKAKLDRTGGLLSNSILFPCIKSGMALGMMNLSFRLINCSFRWLKGMDGPGHASVAGFISSALGFCLVKPPSSLGVYIFFKALESVIAESHKNNNWRIINWIDRAYGGGWCLLYSISTAILFSVGVLEPHNLKPSYYQFLAKATGGKMYDFNRQLIDVYDTNSSLLMKDFWPNLKQEFTSDHMKNLVKMRETRPSQDKQSIQEVIRKFVNVT